MWNPETAYQSLIAPSVVTQAGKVIEPMNKEAVLKNKQRMEGQEDPEEEENLQSTQRRHKGRRKRKGD
jgi:hypothetical protein